MSFVDKTQKKIKNVFFDKTSNEMMNIMRFILVQDPVKVAIGLALGLSIKNIFTEITDDLVKPFVNILIKSISKSELNFTIFGETFGIGKVINQLVIFIIFLVLMYYGFIQPINRLRKRYDIDQKTVACPYCTTLISPNATRCPSCTSQLKT
jgi:large conductance mechanosensitive channel